MTSVFTIYSYYVDSYTTTLIMSIVMIVVTLFIWFLSFVGPGLVAFYTGQRTSNTYTATLYSREIVLQDAMFIGFSTLGSGELKIMVTNDDLNYVLWIMEGIHIDWQAYCINVVPSAVGMPQGAVRLQLQCKSLNNYALAAAVSNITIGYGRCAPTTDGTGIYR